MESAPDNEITIPAALDSKIEKKLGELREKMQSKTLAKDKQITTKNTTANKIKPDRFSSKIKELSREGRFSIDPIHPGNEFPTFLTRVPIFIPTRRKNQRQLFDEDNSLKFNTSWGQGRRFGPPLTTYDEDTLLAIGHLRNQKITGQSHRFPVPVNSVFSPMNDQSTKVHATCCLISDIQRVCRTATGGAANKLRLDSIKRLAGTVIELTASSKEKYVKHGTTIKLLDIAWEEYEKNSLLYIQFSPLMSLWFENEYTYIDLETRFELTDIGKAIHRFLTSQPKHYEIHTHKLQETIKYSRPYKKFMYDLRTTLKDLERLEWLKSYEITGSGRNNPHKLIINR